MQCQKTNGMLSDVVAHAIMGSTCTTVIVPWPSPKRWAVCPLEGEDAEDAEGGRAAVGGLFDGVDEGIEA